RQSEALLALAVRPDHKVLALGRHDGALVLLNEATGKVLAQPLPVKPRPPVLEKLGPTQAVRGQAGELELARQHLRGGGGGINPAALARVRTAVDNEGLSARLSIPATAPPGTYQVRVQNEAGESAPRKLIVDRFRTVAEAEPNDSPRTGQKVTLPATL